MPETMAPGGPTTSRPPRPRPPKNTVTSGGGGGRTSSPHTVSTKSMTHTSPPSSSNDNNNNNANNPHRDHHHQSSSLALGQTGERSLVQTTISPVISVEQYSESSSLTDDVSSDNWQQAPGIAAEQQQQRVVGGNMFKDAEKMGSTFHKSKKIVRPGESIPEQSAASSPDDNAKLRPRHLRHEVEEDGRRRLRLAASPVGYPCSKIPFPETSIVVRMIIRRRRVRRIWPRLLGSRDRRPDRSGASISSKGHRRGRGRSTTGCDSGGGDPATSVAASTTAASSAAASAGAAAGIPLRKRRRQHPKFPLSEEGPAVAPPRGESAAPVRQAFGQAGRRAAFAADVVGVLRVVLRKTRVPSPPSGLVASPSARPLAPPAIAGSAATALSPTASATAAFVSASPSALPVPPNEETIRSTNNAAAASPPRWQKSLASKSVTTKPIASDYTHRGNVGGASQHHHHVFPKANPYRNRGVDDYYHHDEDEEQDNHPIITATSSEASPKATIIDNGNNNTNDENNCKNPNVRNRARYKAIHIPTEVAAALVDGEVPALVDFIRRQPGGRFLPGALK